MGAAAIFASAADGKLLASAPTDGPDEMRAVLSSALALPRQLRASSAAVNVSASVSALTLTLGDGTIAVLGPSTDADTRLALVGRWRPRVSTAHVLGSGAVALAVVVAGQGLGVALLPRHDVDVVEPVQESPSLPCAQVVRVWAARTPPLADQQPRVTTAGGSSGAEATSGQSCVGWGDASSGCMQQSDGVGRANPDAAPPGRPSPLGDEVGAEELGQAGQGRPTSLERVEAWGAASTVTDLTWTPLVSAGGGSSTSGGAGAGPAGGSSVSLQARCGAGGVWIDTGVTVNESGVVSHHVADPNNHAAASAPGGATAAAASAVDAADSAWDRDVDDAACLLQADLSELEADEHKEQTLAAGVASLEAACDALTLLAAAASGDHASLGLPPPRAELRPATGECDGPSVELSVGVPRRLLASDERGWVLALVWRACGQQLAKASQALPLQCVIGQVAGEHAAVAEGAVVVDVPAETLGLWSGSALQACTVEVWLLYVPDGAAVAWPHAAEPDGVMLAQARVDSWWFAGAALGQDGSSRRQAQAATPSLERAWDAAAFASGGALAAASPGTAPLLSPGAAHIGVRVAGMVPSPWGDFVEVLGGGLSASVPWWAATPLEAQPAPEQARVLVTMPGGTAALQCEAVWTRPGPGEQCWRVELRIRPNRDARETPSDHAAAVMSMLGAFLWRLTAAEGSLCRVRVPAKGDSDDGPSAAALAAADLDDALAALAGGGEPTSWDERLHAALTACGASSWYCA